MAEHPMSLEITVKLTRPDGDHYAIVHMTDGKVDTSDGFAVIMMSASAGAEVTEAVAALIVHECGPEADDRPVKLGDSRN